MTPAERRKRIAAVERELRLPLETALATREELRYGYLVVLDAKIVDRMESRGRTSDESTTLYVIDALIEPRPGDARQRIVIARIRRGALLNAMRLHGTDIRGLVDILARVNV